VPPRIVRDVHEARPRRIHHLLQHRAPFVVVALVPHHLEPDVRPVEAPRQHEGVVHAEAFDDVGAHGAGAGGCERDHGRVPEALDDLVETEVVGAEVVPPRRDAVGLVDREERDSPSGQSVDDRVLGELLGGQEHEAGLPALDIGPRRVILGLGVGGVDGCGDPTVVVAERAHLVVLQRDQRGDHHSDAAEHGSGELVDGRFSVARGHHGQHVPTGCRCAHRLELAVAQ
jgi:hypothetical protein